MSNVNKAGTKLTFVGLSFNYFGSLFIDRYRSYSFLHTVNTWEFQTRNLNLVPSRACNARAEASAVGIIARADTTVDRISGGRQPWPGGARGMLGGRAPTKHPEGRI